MPKQIIVVNDPISLHNYFDGIIEKEKLKLHFYEPNDPKKGWKDCVLQLRDLTDNSIVYTFASSTREKYYNEEREHLKLLGNFVDRMTRFGVAFIKEFRKNTE